MRPTLPLTAAALALFVCAPAPAQFGQQEGPFDWAADSVEFVDADNLIRLEGRVNVRQGEARLAADRMRIFLMAADEGEDREIEHIEADGSVVYVTPLEVARGDHGVYVAVSQQITLTGNVTLIRGDTTLAGEELVIEPGVGRSSLSRTTWQGLRSPERVRGVFSSNGPADASDDEAAP